jgi:hypothetical protein
MAGETIRPPESGRTRLAAMGREQAQENSSRKCDALSYELRWGGWTCGQVARRIVGTHGLRCGIGIAAYRDFVRDFQTPSELMCGAVRNHLDPLAFDLLTVRNPNPLAVAVTGVRIPSIWIRLLHRAVGIEDIHVVGERRVGILNNPGSHNGVWRAVSGRGNRTAELSDRRSDQEAGYKKPARRDHVHPDPKIPCVGSVILPRNLRK